MLAHLDEFFFLFVRESAAERRSYLIAFLNERECVEHTFSDHEEVVLDVMGLECFFFSGVGIDASVFYDFGGALRVESPDVIFEDE